MEMGVIMKKGYIYTALSAIIFGLMPLLTKIIIARGTTSLTIPFFRVFYVTIVLFLVLKIKKIDFHLEKRDLLSVMLTSIFGSGLTIIILNESYNYVDTGIATSLHFLYPLFVAILCCFFYGEKIKKKQIISLSFALVGIICFMSKGNGSLFGYFLAIASGLTYAFYLVKMDKTGLVKMNAFKLSFYLALFTTIEIFTMNLFMQDVVFKMERPGLVEVGQTVEVTESVTPFNVNYMIEPAVAMSGLFKLNDRIPADHGVVKAIEENDRGYYVTVTFEYE